MGKKSNRRKQANPANFEVQPLKVLCVICNQPSAINYDDGTVRAFLAKTMIKVVDKSDGEARYVHEDPCLPVLLLQLQEYQSKRANEHT